MFFLLLFRFFFCLFSPSFLFAIFSYRPYVELLFLSVPVHMITILLFIAAAGGMSLTLFRFLSFPRGRPPAGLSILRPTRTRPHAANSNHNIRPRRAKFPIRTIDVQWYYCRTGELTLIPAGVYPRAPKPAALSPWPGRYGDRDAPRSE